MRIIPLTQGKVAIIGRWAVLNFISGNFWTLQNVGGCTGFGTMRCFSMRIWM
jgi:hypothetical protein